MFNLFITSALLNTAPTARNMKARGKREAKRSASPLGHRIKSPRALKGRNYFGLSGLNLPLLIPPGATRCALAPGFHISRLCRSNNSRNVFSRPEGESHDGEDWIEPTIRYVKRSVDDK